MSQVILATFTASVIGFIVYDPSLFLEYSKYPLFLFANVATHNNFRNDPYNDKLSYGLELFIYWTFMFNKGILLTYVLHGRFQWVSDPDFFYAAAYYAIFHFFFSKLFLPIHYWKNFMQKEWVQYVVFVMDRICQTGPILVFLKVVFIDGHQLDNQFLVYVYLTQSGVLVSLILSYDFGLPFWPTLIQHIAPTIIGFMVYLPPYFIVQNYANQQTDRVAFVQKVTLGWFCLAESLNRFKQLGNTQNKLKRD